MWWHGFSNHVHSGLQPPWAGQMLFGIMLVLLGILILLVPQILVALIATGLILAGAATVGSAWQARRLWQDIGTLWRRYPF